MKSGRLCAFRFCFGFSKMVTTGGRNTAKFLEAQMDEIEVLHSIFGDEWKTENEADRSYSMEIREGDISLVFYVTLSENYPYDSPPKFTISAPELKWECKQHLNNLLEEVYLQNIGQVVLFQWIEKIKEYLASLVLDSKKLDALSEIAELEDEAVGSGNQEVEIIHGETVTDRKSTFQGHAAFVTSLSEVKNALNQLKKNRKIANATHNMYAYRVSHMDGTLIQECSDDGEKKAGSWLLQLLQNLDAINVLIVVSRWYHGIHLGSVRFYHINNAAKQALEQAGVISINKKKS